MSKTLNWLAAALCCFTALAQAAPIERVVSTTPSVTGILLAIDAPLLATAATTPSRLSDEKGFFSQWAAAADEKKVQVLYRNLNFDLEAVLALSPDLLVISSTGADSVLPHISEIEALQIPTLVVNYSDQSWQEIALEIGQKLGIEENAHAAIARFDQRVAELAKQTNAQPNTRASIIGYNLGGTYSISKTVSPHARLLSALGFSVQPLPEALSGKVTRSSDFDFVSRENLAPAIAGDVVFLMGGNDKDVDAFLADPVLAQLPAVKNKQVYPLGVTSFRIDYYSGLQMAETVANYYH